jgi:hypothetical protein
MTKLHREPFIYQHFEGKEEQDVDYGRIIKGDRTKYCKTHHPFKGSAD